MASLFKSILLFIIAMLAVSSALAAKVCDTKSFSAQGLDMTQFAYCDKSLGYRIRAKNLVDTMTIEEKVKQLGNQAPGVRRLGIPAYNWWSEILHGVSDVGGGSNFNGPVPGATSFPTPITTTAAFNQDLWHKIGKAASTEARAMNNLGVAGLTFWSPVINVVRDPRWGRTLETSGEDPFVNGVYAVNYVRGLQDVEGSENVKDPNSRDLKVAACCKHYAAYDIDQWVTYGGAVWDRFHYNSNVTEQDMAETFLRPFEMCVKEGDVSSVMCSYNRVNGIPTCADSRLLSGTIRGDWNLHGYIVSDCDSIEVMMDAHKFNDDAPEDAVAQVLQAGLDMDCGSFYPNYLQSALDKGLIKESDIDKALINTYVVLMRLGWFDGHKLFDSLGAKDVCSKEHIDLATDAARQGMVLLANAVNEANHLPLDPKKHKEIAVVGPHGEATAAMLGNYAGKPCGFVTPVDGLKKYGANIVYETGCGDVHCRNTTFIWPAVRAARKADATVIITGLNLDIEAEGNDRVDLELPGYQNLMIRMVAAEAKGPVILVILSAGGVNIAEFTESPNISAILWAGYPGQQGGQAIADVIYGKYNPAGRVPVTWFEGDYVWKLPMTSMPLRPIDELGYPGRTYKFFNGSTIYPFGHGLSYTNFSYKLISNQRSITKKLAINQHCQQLHYNSSAYIPPCHSALADDLKCDKDDITIQVAVTNTGTMDGDDVVMLYSSAPHGIIDAPIKQLVGFQRVFVPAGKTVNATFSLKSCTALSIVTSSAYIVVPSGEHTFSVGSEPDQPNYLHFPFQVYIN
ncbi:Xylan 1,4-beta-xylosidase protein [Dioscorea alata]|uniref:Xylan 1,4-beta-xylosidase protein n=1 Tax=Dioscorea alata TaxID=55571 RepID=A0ACB7VPL8_DIOAL|nr:Xylan 1,4-beta-xylosidase protein [Dioscorea alata]